MSCNLLKVCTIAEALKCPAVNSVFISEFWCLAIGSAPQDDDGLSLFELSFADGRNGFQTLEQGVSGNG